MNSVLRFPSSAVTIDRSQIEGVALETSGHIETVEQLRLHKLRKLFVLLSSRSLDVHTLHNHQIILNGIPVHQHAFAVQDQLPFENIGEQVGRLPVAQIHGRLQVEDVVQLPVDILIENPDPHGPTKVAICELSNDTVIQLPSGANSDDIGRELYIHGQSIRMTNTFPDKPGGGVKRVA